MRINRKIKAFLITVIIISSIVGLAIARTSQFDDFSGEGHASCHGDITQSSSGYISISSSSGTSISPNEIFTVSIQINSFTEAQGSGIAVGFPSGSPGRGDNKNFAFDATQKSASIDGSGNSIIINFQVTAPSTEQSYTLHADAIYRAGGSSSFFAHGDFILTIEALNNPPQFSNIGESADPLELGQEETVSVDVTDSETTVSTVLIELGSINYTMSNTVGNTYEYNWTPNITGLKNYIIYASDTEGSWNSFSGSVNVIDTTIPTLSNLIESADPLELGQIETIQINVTDLSGISQVLLEIVSVNYTMTNILGTIWEYNSWNPINTGLKIYSIYASDADGNWNSLSDSITVQDTVLPSLTNLVESADPLELEQTESIQINVTDLSIISQVLIEIDSINYTMTNVGGSLWEYDSWTPTSTGLKSYTIYASDSEGNWNTLTNSITVQDTIPPNLFGLVENADPLELGQTEVIQINATDLSGINQVLLEIESVNYTMTNIGGATWEYDSWTPTSTGLKSYTIYVTDNEGNKNSISSDITVIDTSVSTISNLIESVDPLELGHTEIIQINATDLSGIGQVVIEIESVNYTMTNIGGATWEYDSWTPTSTGLKSYAIYVTDNEGNRNSISSDITVIDTTAPTYNFLIESADPLPLGQNETISIEVYDAPGSGVKNIFLEYDNVNHTMNFMGFDTWRWANWQPASENIFNYTIYMVDNSDNLNMTNGSIEVIISSGPTIQNLSKSEDPLELGQLEVIEVDISDSEGVSIVFIEISGINYTMTNIGGVRYQHIWEPNTTGIKLFKVYANDSLNNWNQISGSILVQDTTPPNFGNLIKSVDPLELGNSIAITIDTTDLSGINQVKIEYESVNHSMYYIGGNTWLNDTWIPDTVGIYQYFIYIQDNSNNWNFTSDLIEVIDTTAPVLTNLYENADPLELGQTEMIQVDIIDYSPISSVLIEIEGTNYTMSKINTVTWEYSSWNPTSTGLKSYTIYVSDSSNNDISLIEDISVVDTTGPILSNLLESDDPLQFGQTENIQINVTDLSGIGQVIIEIESVNYTMSNIGGSTWEYDSWTPTSTGLQSYTIYADDNEGNRNSLTNDITVVDTNGPTLSMLSESADPLELGQIETIQLNATDLSGINQMLIEINGVNYTMANAGGNTWEYNSWTPTNTGLKLYTIYAEDTKGNWVYLTNSITVQDTIQPSLTNLVESADPIELGQTEIISIEVIDLAPITQVLIEIDSINYTLSNIGGAIWEYSSWIPTSIGVKDYVIYAKDINNNWNNLENNISVIDTTAPTLVNLVEISDPLELGDTAIIQVEILDFSPINLVLFETEGINYTMTFVEGITWRYNNWTPYTTGLKIYSLYAIDLINNTVSLDNNITVIDTSGPAISNLVKGNEPTYLGQSTFIQVNVIDFSNVSEVLIEFEGSNHTMINTAGNTWEFDNWVPSTTGDIPFTIHARDTNDNWNSVSENILVTVQSTSVTTMTIKEITDLVVQFSIYGTLIAGIVLIIKTSRKKRFFK
ncbi:MAG: hypothetical protein KGD58_10905 [Candidatus Lokiarchaeota archaeon]|nr:hypothetical protein [Candidatus Lokiarchaeota archaeon]